MANYTRTEMFEKTITEKDFLGLDSLWHAVFIASKDGYRNTYLLDIEQCTDAPYPRHEAGRDYLWTWVTTRGAAYSDVVDNTVPSSTARHRIEDFEDEDGKISLDPKEYLVVPLHLYRHGEDHISVGRTGDRVGTNCQFDSGTMGFAFVSRADLDEQGISDASALTILQGEVDEVNAHNRGDVYNFILTSLDEGEVIDSICCCMATTGEDFLGYVEDVAGHLREASEIYDLLKPTYDHIREMAKMVKREKA